MEGEVIGVNTAIISPTGGSIGIGFAVPSNTATKVLGQLKEFGETRRGWLGVHVQNVTDELTESLGLSYPQGALVAAVTPDGPASAAGIEPRDVILEFDGQRIGSMRDLPRAVAGATIGKDVPVALLRGGETREVTVKIGRMPEKDEAARLGEDEPRLLKPEEHDLLGLSIAPLTDAMRTEYGISGKIEGVVITDVAPDSPAARKQVKPGEVIVEVTQEEVRRPEDVVSLLKAVKKSGRRRVLLLLSDAKGELRFVAVPTS
jgi:serine protease Do